MHHPGRLRIVATLAVLPEGDALSVTRLQDMSGLTPGSLTTCLRQLDQASYVRTGRTRGDAAPATAALTGDGRAALDHYTAVLRQLSRMASEGHQAPAPYLRAGDADRDAAAAALGEHFAQGRLTLDELSTRLDATLAATTHGELSLATGGLPEMTVLPARVGVPRGKRATSRPKPGPAPGRRAWPHRRGRTRGGSS